ncbi:MAG TPA: hypothetical protein VFC78_09395 [Tepidisphaeraceae bacterium]|nr:hypothetical protein [Tepidisphaeraceae bacterium]
MKQLVFIPLILGLAALLGYGVLRASGMHPHAREMFAALIPSVVAGMVALLPAILQRAYGQAAVVQGAFHGMIIHIGLTVALALALYFALGLQGSSTDPFAMWLLWFFGVTLLMVSGSLIRVIRATPVVRSELPNH